MTPLVLGRPRKGGLDATLSLVRALRLPVTLVWSDRPELEDVVPALLEAGGSTLYVDTELPGNGEAALAHQLQVMGVPHFIVAVVHVDTDLLSVLALVRMALASLPPTAVLVDGSAETWAAVAEIATELELQPPLAVTPDDMVVMAESLATAARWETA